MMADIGTKVIPIRAVVLKKNQYSRTHQDTIDSIFYCQLHKKKIGNNGSI